MGRGDAGEMVRLKERRDELQGSHTGGFLKSQSQVLCLHSEGEVSPMSLQSRGSIIQESHRHVGKVCGHQWLLQKSPCVRPHYRAVVGRRGARGSG